MAYDVCVQGEGVLITVIDAVCQHTQGKKEIAFFFSQQDHMILISTAVSVNCLWSILKGFVLGITSQNPKTVDCF